MANAEAYAQWIVANPDKRGTPEFETVAAAYKAARSESDKPEGFAPALGRGVMNFAAGILPGAATIGNTLLASPADLREAIMGPDKNLSSLVTGQAPKSRLAQRNDANDALMKELGADTSSLAYGAGKLTPQLAGTLGVGGGIANAARAVLPAVAARAAPLLSAIETAGMSSGGVGGAAGVGLRAAGGGVTGAASAGLVNPGDIGMGAGVGAALPGVLQALGMGGRAVGELFKGNETRAAERLARGLELTPAQVAQLTAAQELVPGSRPTVAQVLRTPQAGILERVVSDSPGGAALKSRYVEQNAARLAALDRVAPVDPRGFRTAQEDFGTAALNVIRPGDAAAKKATSAVYQSIPQDQTAFYMPDFAPIRDEIFPVLGIGQRGAVDRIIKASEDVGTMVVPGISPTKMKQGGGASLAQAVRKMGGISVNNNSGLRGEVASLRGDLKNLVRVNGGLSPASMAEAMQQRGYLTDDSTDALFEALRSEARGGYSASSFADVGQSARAGLDAAMGDAPGASRIPQKVTLRQFDAIRKDIGGSQRAAGMDPERATESLALSRMKEAMDARINEVVSGDGAFDEVLPLDWANKLTEGQALKKAQVAKYRTGPQAAAFDRGSDNLPKVQGGEFAAKVWGNRPGIANDIKQFRAVLDEQPDLLGKFRSMITTEGAGTATANDELSSKFVRWVDNSLPGLKASFEPEQVKALQRIAADIKRAGAGASAGMSRGSNTYQNASNALSLGLLDNPMLTYAANRVPFANAVTGPGLQWMRETARERMARDLAGLLADPTGAAAAVAAMRRQSSAVPGLLGANVLRAAPVLAADQ